MKLEFTIGVAIVGLLACSLDADYTVTRSASAAAKADSLEGEWQPESIDGRPVSKPLKVVFSAGQVDGLFRLVDAATLDGPTRESRERRKSFEFRTFPQGELSAIDVDVFSKASAGFRGIYKIEGDVLTMAFQPKLDARADSPWLDKDGRPNTLDPDRVVLRTFRRISKEAKSSRQSSTSTHAPTDSDAPGASAPEPIIAWGKPHDGLQAGLRCRAERPVAAGDVPLELEVVVRNISKRPIEFPYSRPDHYGYSKEDTVVTGQHVAQRDARTRATLQPRGLLVVGTMYIGHRRPKRNSLVDDRPFWIDLGEGLVQVGSDNALGGDGTTVPKLSTGYLDVEIRRQDAPAKKPVQPPPTQR
jgi:hypothetical protein